MKTSSRRGFIAGGAALGVLGLAGLTSCGNDTTGSATSTTQPVGTSPDLSPVPPVGAPPEAHIARVGEVYRHAVPDEDDRGALEELLPDLAGLAPPLAVAALPTLEPAIRDDFGAGRTFEVDGWILAVTEGRAAALISLA